MDYNIPVDEIVTILKISLKRNEKNKVILLYVNAKFSLLRT